MASEQVSGAAWAGAAMRREVWPGWMVWLAAADGTSGLPATVRAMAGVGHVVASRISLASPRRAR